MSCDNKVECWEEDHLCSWPNCKSAKARSASEIDSLRSEVARLSNVNYQLGTLYQEVSDELCKEWRYRPVLTDIIAERRRQIESKGWSPEHDDTHVDGEIGDAAACYAAGRIRVARGRDAKTIRFSSGQHTSLWPWEMESWKPTTRRRNLVKAAALIMAEIERLDRAARATSTPSDEAGIVPASPQSTPNDE